MKLYRQRQILT